MEFIDSHAHLYAEEFDSDLNSVVNNAKELGVVQVLLPNIDEASIDRLFKTCNLYPDFFKPMMGLHPTSVKSDYKRQLQLIYAKLKENRSQLIAVGEVGLDFYWDKTFKEEQIIAFEQQLEWALDENLPVVIHSREAYKELEEILKNPKWKTLRGVIHSFSGNEEDLDRFLALDNWMIGINGILTFNNSTLSSFVKKIPLKRLLIETDSPYLAPVPFRGRRNESAYLFHTLKKLADCYEISVEKMAEQTKNNTLDLFAIHI